MADVIVLEGVSKRFPGVVANDRVDLVIRSGEVHVLLGENGAGKSTLIDLLSGVQQPDGGRILIDGKPAVIASPKHALAYGIGTVFQHTMLVPSLTAGENLLLGAPWWRIPRKAELAARAAEISEKLGLAIDLETSVADLSLGERQQVEILRALLRRSRVLILDESTSMLTPKGIEDLGALMRKLANQGLAIVFITHKLKEAVAYGDRISILKLGRKVGEIAASDLRQCDEQSIIAGIVEMMFGRRGADPDAVRREDRVIPQSAPVLEVRNLALPAAAGHHGLKSVDFDVRAGEIFGVAGIDGNGQKQLAEALAGQCPAAAGSIRLSGVEMMPRNQAERRALGLRYLTDDRLGEGTVSAFPVATNFFLKEIGSVPLWRHGIEQRRAIASRAAELVKQYDVRTPSVLTPIGRLSGGNIQKLVIARELAEGARIVVLNKPTYGLDLANTLATRDRIRGMAAAGMGVVLISTDLEELLALADRIAVMAGGSISGIVDNGETAHNAVGRLMTGLAA
jgi:simple sugar transport system ATP-binding protein